MIRVSKLTKISKQFYKLSVRTNFLSCQLCKWSKGVKEKHLSILYLPAAACRTRKRRYYLVIIVRGNKAGGGTPGIK